MKKNVLYFQLLLFVAGLICFSNISQAQIEDFQVGATTRKMLVYAPSGIEPGRPLLLSLHGLNQDIAYQQNQTKWETVAKENNFVVVYPGGINNSWDISGTSDTDFILAIIDEMYKRYGIDRDRVYLSGFSMGGMMTYHAATKIADKIAAFAPVSGYLMGGPNTNSSRPIPIIHTHGTGDNVVPYSGVATCLNAWIDRNNCPTTAQVTQPYPVEKTSSNCTKYYWGPGTDSVKIVLLSLAGVGHWHSLDPNGVNTSEEIWNFCKNFSLGFGVPKFLYASVRDINPKQIQVELSLPIKESDSYNGFTVKVDGESVVVDTVLLTDSVHFAINLSESVLNSSEIQLSYTEGNIVSIYDKNLVSFTDTLVDNLLTGSSPRIVELFVTENGDTLKAKFNKKMLIPSSIDSLALKADYNGEMNIPLVVCSFIDTDSTVLVFPLGEKVYADYKLSLSYTGSSIVSADSGLLKTNPNYAVTNKSKGLPVHIVSAALETNAIAFALGFSKPMTLKDSQIGQFVFTANGENVAIKEIFTLNNTIRFILSGNLYYGDTIKVSYSPGDVTSADKGNLEAFTDFIIENPLTAPTYYQVTGKIEAENSALQFGTATETTGDIGGGLNVGWTDTGDWLVYAIENNTDETEFQILFRVAAQSSGSRFDYYLDNEKIGYLNVPSTGGWQVWQSVIKEISIPKGKHYIKLVTVTGGFNINYFDIQLGFAGIHDQHTDNMIIYPNPASNEIVIKSTGFRYNKVEIIDAMGKTVLCCETAAKPELLFPINLANGVYIVKISDGLKYQSKRIVINRN